MSFTMVRGRAIGDRFEISVEGDVSADKWYVWDLEVNLGDFTVSVYPDEIFERAPSDIYVHFIKKYTRDDSEVKVSYIFSKNKEEVFVEATSRDGKLLCSYLRRYRPDSFEEAFHYYVTDHSFLLEYIREDEREKCRELLPKVLELYRSFIQEVIERSRSEGKQLPHIGKLTRILERMLDELRK